VNPVQSLKKLKALLKADGVIIFSIPNMAHISVRLALMAGDFTYTKTGLLDKTHLHFYTGEEVSRIFTDAGYELSTFDCSSLQYPLDLHKKKLKELGLQIKSPDEYKEMLRKSHGNVYQYFGSAKKVDKKIIKQPPVPVTNAHEKDYKIIEQTIYEQKKHLQFLEESVKLKDDHIQNLEKIIEDLKNHSLKNRIKRKLND
jgi:hypothetical protein